RSRCCRKCRVRRIFRPPALKMKNDRGKKANALRKKMIWPVGWRAEASLMSASMQENSRTARSMISTPLSLPRGGEEAIEETKGEAAGLKKGARRQDYSPLALGPPERSQGRIAAERGLGPV